MLIVCTSKFTTETVPQMGPYLYFYISVTLADVFLFVIITDYNAS